MRQTLNGMRRRGNEDRGFTMIELLVVVVIIGILVAIAVPVYLNYRQGAQNKSAQSDVRGAIPAIEQFYTENNAYPADRLLSSEAQAGQFRLRAPNGSTGQAIAVSPGNVLGYRLLGPASYRICGMNEDGKQVYVYNSATGGAVTKSSTTSVSACLDAN